MQTPLRGYQRQALAQFDAHPAGAIVVLPTGAGKTLIAAAAAAAPRRTLFLVPTVLLVEQQAAAVRRETGLTVAQHRGGKAPPAAAGWDVLVATPAAFLARAAAGAGFGLSSFGLLVFDEVHHVVKKHPYRQVALLLQGTPAGQRPKVLGLTASLTHAVGNGALEHVLYCNEGAGPDRHRGPLACSWQLSARTHRITVWQQKQFSSEVWQQKQFRSNKQLSSKVWQPLNVVKSSRHSNNQIISGAVHGRMSG